MLCRGTALQRVVELTASPVINPNTGDVALDAADRAAISAIPLDLYLCEDCGHLQLTSIVDPDIQYSNYTYRTGTSLGLARHFETLADDITAEAGAGGLAVEIG